MTPKEWRKLRIKLVQQVLHLDISALAKTLWVELAMNWCWEGPDCFPGQNALSVVLGIHQNTTSRLMIELVESNLLKRVRAHRGHHITLVTAIPEPLLADEWRFDNRILTQRVKADQKMKRSANDAVRSQSPKKGLEVQETKKPLTNGVVSQSLLKGLTSEPVTLKVIDQSLLKGMYRSIGKGKPSKERNKHSNLKRTRSKTNESVQKSEKDRVRLKNSESREEPRSEEPDVEQKTYVEPERQVIDPSDLMEDPLPIQMQYSKNKRGKRAPSLDLVASSGHGLQTASQPPEGTRTVQAGPSAPMKPQAVLALLRGEIEEKYGSKPCKDIPYRLTGKLSTQIENIILSIYNPTVVIGMIRVLVWDWEVARTTCFPYRPQISIPTVEALVQYQETLAAAVSTGLTYTGARRGEWKTYRNRYLGDLDLFDDDDPYR